ncbi:MAG: hypothetical protein AB4042_19840 [Leptolyngbyaceae cyanobacterium]
MRTLDQQIRYQELELVAGRSPRVPHPIKTLATRLGQSAQGVLRWFTPSHDPHIWTTTLKGGQTCWHVYDPVDQQRLTLISEEEVRVWLDNRYNR